MASSKSLQIISTGEGVEKREPSYTADCNVSWYDTGKQSKIPLKTKNRVIIWSSDPTSPVLGIYPEKSLIQKDTHASIHSSNIHNNQNMEAT